MLSRPSSTIAILSRSDPDRLVGLVGAIMRQSVLPTEILVIWNGPDAVPALGAMSGVRLIRIPPHQFGHGRTRNLALRETSTEVLTLLSDDACPADEHWLKALLAPFVESSDISATFSRQVGDNDGSTDAMFRDIRYPATSFAIVLGKGRMLDLKRMPASNASAAYKVHALRDLGGFAEELIASEDLAATIGLLDAGFRVWYAASSIVVHSHNYSFVDQVRRTFDITVSHRQIGQRYHVRLPHWWDGYGALGMPLVRTFGAESPRAALHVGAYVTARVAGIVLAKLSWLVPLAVIRWISGQRWFYIGGKRSHSPNGGV